MTESPPQPRRKLIEVALPLDAINKAAAREKSIRHGHPSTLHLWWARRPLAACRAVLFASLVDDPSSDPTLSEEEADRKRDELFALIEELVQWENSTNGDVLGRARAAILASTGGNPPPVLDPFCGGGSIPLEAQRLGLEAHASDLNPVAVLITKALIEIPPKFAGMKPTHPDARRVLNDWSGAQGLAADVRAYGRWMRDEAERRIGHLYPKARLPRELGGGEATVIAWLWARTVTCPNPACGAGMPLVRSFALSTKRGGETWVEPVVDACHHLYEFVIRKGPGVPDGTVGRRGARCIVCETPVTLDYIRRQGRERGLGTRLMAVVVEGQRGRTYLAPDEAQVTVAMSAEPSWRLDTPLPRNPRDFKTPNYGLTTFGDLFTDRQLVALTTFSDLVGEARGRVLADARLAGLPDDGIPLAEGGTGAQAYADAVATYLAFAVDKAADRLSTICTWDSSPKMEALRNTFARQAIPMTWDFAEGNPFSRSSGNWTNNVEWVANALMEWAGFAQGFAEQKDARLVEASGAVVSTDPPYYDNVGYADLSDFFYVWLRRSLGPVFPDLFATLLTPKADELIASPYRHDGNKDRAEEHFERGSREVFARLCAMADRDVPITVFYAFKQAESESNGRDAGISDGMVASTGWETMLSGLIDAGLAVHATWPMRTELSNRPIASGTNALASSIVLACRPRPVDAPLATRTDFVRALRRELPQALRQLQHGSIAPVDLAQAAIGPGMKVYTGYREVREPSGDRLAVRTALALINQILDEILTEQEGEYDPYTRMAIAWFETHGMREGPYGDAETLATAKNTSVAALVEAGIMRAGGGRVALLPRELLPADWNPATDTRLTVWEITQHLIRALETGGQGAAAAILRGAGPLAEAARDLAYRLYAVCERKGWTAEAQAYNSLVVAWPELVRLAAEAPAASGQRQETLL
jgi:putative DNA methylase